MNTDIRVSVSFPSHPKTVKLTKKLGPQGPLSFIYLLIFAGQNKPTGRLEGMDEEDIAIAAQWPKDPKTFVDALVSVKYLERENRTLIIHDWKDHNPYAVHSPQRIEKAKKAAQARWGNQQAKECPEHNQALPLALDSNAPSPAPIPSPTPDPIPKEVKAPAEPDNPPVDNSCPEKTPFEETEKGQELTTPAFDEFGPGKNGNGQDEQTELNQIIEDLRKKHFSNDLEKAFNLFLRKYMPDKNTNYKALIHCFKSLQKKLGIKNDPDPVRDYFKYLESALIVENGKYNAADYQESIKKKGMATSADLMRAIGMKAGGLPQ